MFNDEFVISNKNYIAPRPPKPEPVWNGHFWDGYSDKSYEFRQFLGNCMVYLGEELSNLDGMQQLIHQYYLQNGGINARDTAERIKVFISPPPS
jgi:hypothetical protein